MGRIAALGAAACLASGCALFNPALLAPSKCLGPHQPAGEWTAAELSAQGLAYLETALSVPSLAFPFDRAASCFLRAQQLSAQDYGVNLGLGVAALSKAKIELQKGEKAKASALLGDAKKTLSTAYFVSQGQLEPVYYLAEVATLEDSQSSLNLARSLLLHLEKVGYKLGPVYVLLGFLSEKAGSKDKARGYYAAAMQQHWPASSANYAEVRNQSGGK